jgi:ubiquinone/menaquinone biosynthesis C-methylase UbiE
MPPSRASTIAPEERTIMHAELATKSRVGEDPIAELYRLRLQADVWQPAADEFFAVLHLQRGARAIDLCCGAVGVLEPLSRAVGPSGTVIGVESNPVRLKAARAFVDQSDLANVTVVEGHAVATGLPSGQFDLVHCRFLFAPMGQADRILTEMLRLLRPGGYIAIQEPDGSCWNVAPRNANWSRLKAAIFGAIRAQGGDFDAGLHTFGILRAAGMREVSQRNAVVACHGRDPYKQLPLQFANWLRPQILDGGLMSEDRLEECMEDVITTAADPATVMTSFLVTQVAARKM